MKKAIASNQMGLFQPDPEPWERPAFLPDWTKCPLMFLDFETKDDGLNQGRGAGWAFKDHGYITGFSICNEEKALYFPVRHPDSDNFDVDAAHRWIKAHVTRPNGKTIYHHAGYDTGWIYREIGVIPQNTICTMILATMIDENQRSYSLDNLCRKYGIPGKDKTVLNEAAAALGVHPGKEMWKLPARYVGAYGEGDAIATYRLYKELYPEIGKQELERATQVEFDLVEVLMQMRYRGIRINQDRLEQLRVKYFTKRDEILDRLSQEFQIGRQVSIDDLMSSKKLGSLFDMAGLEYPFTKTGLPSFESDWLEAQDHWIPKSVALAKKFDQAADKFLAGYIGDSIVDGRVHGEIHQLRDGDGGTKSYRLSMSNPPLQQMPANDQDIGKEIREVFLPEEGAEWIVGDYSQQEPRFTVHYAAALGVIGWEKAVQYYTENPSADYHQMVSDMTGFPRHKAKILNLSMAYGLGLPNLALRLGISEDEAKQTMDHYHGELPFVRGVSRICQNKVQASGFIKLIDGARCRFELFRPKDDWYGPAFPWEIAQKKWPGQALARADARKAMNRLIQGSAARQTKKAMLDCYHAGYLPMLQMHDDLSFSGIEEWLQPIRDLMINAIPLRVPMKVDLEIGPSWGSAKEVKV